MKLDKLARHPLSLQSRVPDAGLDLRAIHCDSRRVGAGTGFFALKGFSTDGHRFIDAALASGAPAVFVSDPAQFARLTANPSSAHAVFRVPPGRQALAGLSDAIYGSPSRELTLLGVTGTNGKTTVTHLVRELLKALGRPVAVLGTLGGRMGDAFGGDTHVPGTHTTPEAPDIQAFLRGCVDRGISTAAMEVSSHGLALERTHGLRFFAAAFTNLSQDHLDFHASLEQYRETKFRLFLEYQPRFALINEEDAAGAELAGRLSRECPEIRTIRYGTQGSSQLTALNLSLSPEGAQGLLRWEGNQAPFSLPLPGRFNVENFLAAAGLLLAAGEKLEALALAAASCRGAPGRFERVQVDTPFPVVVDYAHTPHALENLLRSARSMGHGRLRLLFGCGGGRDREKRPLMGEIADRLADQVVLCDDNPRWEDSQAILAQIATGMTGRAKMDIIPNRREAIYALLDRGQAGDTVLLAGKGSETCQEIQGVQTPFDDRQVVRDWAETRGHAGREAPQAG